MSIKYSIVSTLVFGLLLSFVVASGSAATPSKQPLKQSEVTSVSLSAPQTAIAKKNINEKKSLDSTLAYQPTQWKPTSYMGPTHHHCGKHYRSNRRYYSSRVG